MVEGHPTHGRELRLIGGTALVDTTRPPREGVAQQHGDSARVSDEDLKRLIQGAVDQALAAIARGERDVTSVAREVAGRLDARDPGSPADLAALEARLHDLEGRIKVADDRHGRFESRVDELSHHVGQRDPPDLAHVPPEILERSFQAMLDELSSELVRSKGRDETERILDEAITDVRGRSKGAELFDRAEQRIIIRGVGASVSKKLLSAKAAKATFDEVVKHLRVHLPNFRPRPLAAMIRMRSHDFAVEAAVHHHERIKVAEERLAGLLAEAKRIESEAKDADAKAAEGVSRSFMQAVSERRELAEDVQGRVKALEKRAADAEARLDKALSRLEAVENYATRVEAAMIRRTKDGTYRGDFTPVIDAVHAALSDGKPRTVDELAKRVKGVDREVIEAVVREALREGVFSESAGSKVRLKR